MYDTAAIFADDNIQIQVHFMLEINVFEEKHKENEQYLDCDWLKVRYHAFLA